MLKNIIVAITSATVGAVAIFILLVFLYQEGWIAVYPEPDKQIEVLSLLLSAATLIITVVALFVALAAALSYTFIKEAAVNAAVAEAKKEARRAVAPLAERERQAISMGQQAGADRTQELAQALAEEGHDG
jgi:hypothetical protein